MLWFGTEEDLDEFIVYCNSFHPTIKFTYNSSILKLPHMDIMLKIEDDKTYRCTCIFTSTILSSSSLCNEYPIWPNVQTPTFVFKRRSFRETYH